MTGSDNSLVLSILYLNLHLNKIPDTNLNEIKFHRQYKAPNVNLNLKIVFLKFPGFVRMKLRWISCEFYRTWSAGLKKVWTCWLFLGCFTWFFTFTMQVILTWLILPLFLYPVAWILEWKASFSEMIFQDPKNLSCWLDAATMDYLQRANLFSPAQETWMANFLLLAILHFS